MPEKHNDWMASTIDNNVTTDLYNVVQGFWANKDVDAVMKDMDVSMKFQAHSKILNGSM